MLVLAEIEERIAERQESKPALPALGTFEELYAARYDAVLNYCARRLMRMDAAEDVTAETFTRALVNFPKLQRSRAEQEAWLYRTATNLIHDQFRSNKRHSATSLDAVDREAATLATFMEQGSTAERLANLQEFARVTRLIGRLKPKYQDVLVLRFVEEKALEEIAEILDERLGTVKWQLQEGLKQLGALLEKEEQRASRPATQRS